MRISKLVENREVENSKIIIFNLTLTRKTKSVLDLIHIFPVFILLSQKRISVIDQQWIKNRFYLKILRKGIVRRWKREYSRESANFFKGGESPGAQPRMEAVKYESQEGGGCGNNYSSNTCAPHLLYYAVQHPNLHIRYLKTFSC